MLHDSLTEFIALAHALEDLQRTGERTRDAERLSPHQFDRHFDTRHTAVQVSLVSVNGGQYEYTPTRAMCRLIHCLCTFLLSGALTLV